MFFHINKKILPLVLILSILLSLVSFGGMASAKEEPNNQLMLIEKFKNLGIYDETVDLSKPDECITRINFLKLIIKFTGYENMVPKKLTQDLFLDVVRDYSQGVYVKAALELNMLSGYSDGNFYPDSEITFNQAVKILVSSLGYGVKAQAKGGYPTGYNIVARDIGLTSGANSNEGFLTNENLLKILDNMLEVNVLVLNGVGDKDTYEKESPFLQYRHNIYTEKGIVKANSQTSILNQVPTSNNMVFIGNVKMYEGKNKNVSLYLGYTLKSYYSKTKDDENGTLLYYELSKDNKTTYVESEDIKRNDESFSEFKFVYYDNEKQKDVSVSLSSQIQVVVNGVAKNLYELGDIAPQYGDVTLIDNNNDNKIDVLSVFKVDKIVLVESIGFYDDIYLFSNKIGGGSFELSVGNANKSVRVIKDKKDMEISEIMPGEVILIGTTKDDINTIIKVSDTTVEGTIEEVNSKNEILVNSKKYKLSHLYSQYDTKYTKTPKAGTMAKIYLDDKGYIQAINPDKNADLKYGFFFEAKEPSTSLNEKYKLRLLTQEGKLDIFYLDGKVRFNDESIADDQAYERLTTTPPSIVAPDGGKGSENRKLIRFSADENNIIKKIYTVNNTPELKYDGSFVSTSYYEYYAGTWDGKYYKASGTKIFFIYPNIEQCEVVPSSSYDVTDQGEEQKYEMFFYDTDEMRNVGASIVYRDEADVSGSSVTSTSLILVEGRVNAVDSTGTPQECIKGRGTNGVEHLIYIGDNTPQGAITKFSAINSGDIIRYQLNNIGELSGINILFDKNKALELRHENKTGFGRISGKDSPIGAGYTNKFVHQNTAWIYGEVSKISQGKLLYSLHKEPQSPKDVYGAVCTNAQVACIDLSGEDVKIKTKLNIANVKENDIVFAGAKVNSIFDLVIIKFE